jgi:hypothetical protein
LTREYYNSFKDDLHKATQTTKTDKETKEDYENRRKEFLYDINTSGKYHILKEKNEEDYCQNCQGAFRQNRLVNGSPQKRS